MANLSQNLVNFIQVFDYSFHFYLFKGISLKKLKFRLWEHCEQVSKCALKWPSLSVAFLCRILKKKYAQNHVKLSNSGLWLPTPFFSICPNDILEYIRYFFSRQNIHHVITESLGSRAIHSYFCLKSSTKSHSLHYLVHNWKSLQFNVIWLVLSLHISWAALPLLESSVGNESTSRVFCTLFHSSCMRFLCANAAHAFQWWYFFRLAFYRRGDTLIWRLQFSMHKPISIFTSVRQTMKE